MYASFGMGALPLSQALLAGRMACCLRNTCFAGRTKNPLVSFAYWPGGLPLCGTCCAGVCPAAPPSKARLRSLRANSFLCIKKVQTIVCT